ncbi:hypothetical protein [Oleiagrimonas sp. C23AA]|uniref:hypothetical protein n=1 Tax=Oleiagrimonas sp. C23AA TaxID=2719047 RepID=UPI00141ED814|nr:hypothetical protein [Oleiagrimonas sp. C23AA]NII10869.1 hypothetical protein [Oleiagrimonas sp. C23AA]
MKARGWCMPAALAAVALISGCEHVAVKTASPSGDVSYEAVEPPPGPHARYTLKAGQSALGAKEEKRVIPTYPKALIGRGLAPVSVTATLVVDRQGAVKRVLIDGEETDDATTRAFDAAVRKAGLQWHFTPLRVGTWKTEPDGSRWFVGNKAAKPFSLRYRFHFKLVDGKPVVDGGRS